MNGKRAEFYGKILAFRRDESGQSMLFTAFTFFILVIMVGMIVGIGDITTDQMRLQNAADSAAYSGAAVEADCLAQMAWLNEGMAVLYGKAVVASVSNIQERTKKSVSQAWWDPSTAIDSSGVTLGLKAASINDPSCAGNYSWASNGEEWYMHLIKAQRLIAIAAPMLIKNQVYQSAHANYFQKPESGSVNKPLRIAIFPNPGDSGNSAWEFYPEGGSFHDAVLELNPSTLSSSKGWKVTSETDPGYSMEMLHVVVDKSVADNGTYNEWHILLDEPDSVDSDGSSSSNTLDATIKSTDYSPFKKASGVSGATKYKGTVYCSGEYEFSINSKDYKITTYAESDGGTVVMVVVEPGSYVPGGGSGTDARDVVEKTDTGSIIDGDKYELDDDGNFSVNDTSYEGSVTINGLTVPASFPGYISGMRLSWPFEMYLSGKVYATFNNSLVVHYHFNSAIGWIRADDVEAWVRGLTTSSPSRNWRSLTGNQGRREHRIFEYPDATLTNDGRWKYEISDSGSWMQDMSFLKLGLRGLVHEKILSDSLLEGYVPVSSVPRQYNPRDDNSTLLDNWKSDNTLWQEFGKSVWDLLLNNGALWACPPRTPRSNYEATASGGFGGFFDLSTGQLANSDINGDGKADGGTSAYTYSVTAKSSYDPGVNVDGTVYLKRRICTGDTLVDLYNNRYGTLSDIAYHLSDNPLWNLYRSLTTTATPEHDDDSDINAGIAISSGNKDSCGFYVIAKYTNLADEQLADLRRKIYALMNVDKLDLITIDEGVTITRPFFAYVDSGVVYLCIYDPYGAVAMFKHQPKYPFISVNPDLASADFYAADAAGTGPTWEQMKALIKVAPAVVRRYAYHGGANWLASTASTAGFLNDHVGMGTTISTLKFGSIYAKPLELTTQVFRKPLAVCVFKSERMGWLAPLLGRNRDDISQKRKDIGQGNPLYLTEDGNKYKWNSGHFAFAASRVFMRAPDDGGYLTNFAYYDDNLFPSDLKAGACDLANAAIGYPDGIDQITNYEMRGYRQKWLASSYNLFETVWAAQMVPINTSLFVRDVEPYEETVEDINSPADYLINKYTEAARYHYHSQRDGWMKNAYTKDNAWSYESQQANNSWNNITAPPQQGTNNGKSLNWQNRIYDSLVRH